MLYYVLGDFVSSIPWFQHFPLQQLLNCRLCFITDFEQFLLTKINSFSLRCFQNDQHYLHIDKTFNNLVPGFH